MIHPDHQPDLDASIGRRSGVRASQQALILLCVASLATASGASAAEKALWGPATLSDGTSPFPMYRALNVDTLQQTVDWSAIAPTRPNDPRDPNDPAYRWPADIDLAVSTSPNFAINMALLVIYSPPWANGGKDRRWVPDSGDYSDFLIAVSRRYPAVRRWMVWSEPNKAANFQPNEVDSPSAAKAYAPLLDSAYATLKSLNPGNKVIGGMTWTGGEVKPAPFVAQMRLPNGRPPRLDWFGHNPFPFRFPRISKGPEPAGVRDLSDLDTFQREIRSVYKREVPFWLSEFTVQSDRGSNTFATFVSREDQAKWLTAAFRLADRDAPVAGLGWLGLVDQPPDVGNFGLLTTSLQRKPSWTAFQRAPSVRLSPRVSAARTVHAKSVRRRGLGVRVTPRTSARLTVELVRAGRVAIRRSARGRTGKAITIRLKRSTTLRRGTYELRVLSSSRAAAVRKTVRVR